MDAAFKMSFAYGFYVKKREFILRPDIYISSALL